MSTDFDKSVNTKGYYKGYPIMVTIRDENEKVFPLLKKSMKIIDWMIENDFKQSWNLTTAKEWEKENDEDPDWIKQPQLASNKKSEYVCNECGAEGTYRSGTSKAGKPWKGIFCNENKEHVKWI